MSPLPCPGREGRTEKDPRHGLREGREDSEWLWSHSWLITAFPAIEQSPCQDLVSKFAVISTYYTDRWKIFQGDSAAAGNYFLSRRETKEQVLGPFSGHLRWVISELICDALSGLTNPHILPALRPSMRIRICAASLTSRRESMGPACSGGVDS